MSAKFDISFSKSAKISGGLTILLKASESDLAAGAEIADPAGVVARAAKIAKFKAKPMSALDLVAPRGRRPSASSSLVWARLQTLRLMTG